MAKVSKVVVCKHCNNEINSDSAVCPYCKFVFRTEGVIFEPPAYVTIQSAEKGLELDEKKDLDASIRIKDDIYLKLISYFQDGCSDEDRVAAMKDAWLTIQNIMHSNSSVEGIRNVVKIGKRIGELAAAIEAYVAKGGNLDTPINTPVVKTDGDGSL